MSGLLPRSPCGETFFPGKAARPLSPKASARGRLPRRQTSRATLGSHVEAHGAGDVLTFPHEFRANMKFTPTQIRALATNSQFPAENLEKVLRLRELLIEFHKHRVLKGKTRTQRRNGPQPLLPQS